MAATTGPSVITLASASDTTTKNCQALVWSGTGAAAGDDLAITIDGDTLALKSPTTSYCIVIPLKGIHHIVVTTIDSGNLHVIVDR